MEKITNYKLKDFLKLNDEVLISNYLLFLELLQPVSEISHPKSRWYNKVPKKLQIKPVKSLLFGEVAEIRDFFSSATIEGIIECVSRVTDLDEKDVLEIRIIDFYSIIATIKQQLIEIANMEVNELLSDDFDINLEAINANQRMGRFGVLNVINSLAGEDLTKWQEIEQLPYMVVFTKLRMDKEKAAIQKELAEIQKKKQK